MKKDSPLTSHPSPRIGFGLDIHPFKKGRALVLGGVKIPHSKGLDGHSDADALIHAIMDGLLGAAALRDIGMHFPPHEKYKNISSLLLLRKVKALLKKNHFQIENIDSTLVIEAPKIAPFIEKMRGNISKNLEISLLRVNVKATRSEGLGFVGRGEGVAAYAVCLLKSLTSNI
ncbi:MAG: 2-C-methyl-D-erythritol 2,4-cyclodiphosphate synthase [Chlamydiae bacterium]|nr:2-C-methyl-D-erythritol 2,4-cyclodiphosphate synthase [Chlamydiota bacterium]MBI3265900.1 2-C-methyl-D-erythritol 2,4-cyclodiphosphate synthase [Chlamydiota bacterium]